MHSDGSARRRSPAQSRGTGKRSSAPGFGPASRRQASLPAGRRGNHSDHPGPGKRRPQPGNGPGRGPDARRCARRLRAVRRNRRHGRPHGSGRAALSSGTAWRAWEAANRLLPCWLITTAMRRWPKRRSFSHWPDPHQCHGSGRAVGGAARRAARALAGALIRSLCTDAYCKSRGRDLTALCDNSNFY